MLYNYVYNIGIYNMLNNLARYIRIQYNKTIYMLYSVIYSMFYNMLYNYVYNICIYNMLYNMLYSKSI